MRMIAAILLCVLLGACSTIEQPATPPASGTAEVPSTPVDESTQAPPTATALMPLRAYRLDHDQSATYQSAFNVAVDDCMRRFGFEPYPAPPFPLETELVSNGHVTDPSLGYGQPRNAEQEAFDQAASDYEAWAQANPMTPAYAGVLHGAAYTSSSPGGDDNAPPLTEYQGIDVPDGGCQGEATRALGGDPTKTPWDDLVKELVNQSWERTRTDAQVTEATAQWATCMRAAGFDYATPDAAQSDERWGVSEHENLHIATATTDEQCRVESGYAEAMVSALERYQTDAIEEHATELAELKTSLDTMVTQSEKLLADGGQASLDE